MRALLILIGCAPVLLFAQTPLSDGDRLKAETHLLKVHAAQCDAQLADAIAKLQTADLIHERAALEAAFRVTEHPAEGTILNWTSLTFELPAKK